MNQDLPAACPFGCGAEQEPKEDQDFGPGGYACGSAIVPGEPKEESGFQSIQCKLTIAHRRIAELEGKLGESRQVTEHRRGVAIIVQRGSKLLTCLRENCRDMNGRWQFGGGAVERDESIEQAAYRELHEETGMIARNIAYLCDTFGFTTEGEPMWTSFFVANCDGYEPTNTEPDKHGAWEWVEADELLTRPIIDVMRPAIATLARIDATKGTI